MKSINIKNKSIFLISLFCFCGLLINCTLSKSISSTDLSLPNEFKGKFEDDYGIQYEITDSIFSLLPNDNFQILKWDDMNEYMIVKNDLKNTFAPGLYGKLDIIRLKNMAPYDWGYCFSAYDAKSSGNAKKTQSADKLNPKKGCNGYPFTRMRIKG